ncbi:MAG: NAD-dependent epimerase/dehydratase family protein [Bryobacteraceae bacterium]|nr:NAD-dependent epimerase/dehydratase family protein [Bryobacteraceae bacterium]
MRKEILITGGAGFIGSHLANELLAHGHRIRIFDNLTPQVHGASRSRPDYLSAEADLRIGDIRDPDAVRSALEDIQVVFHFAARVGVGQSMYETAEYSSVNSYGTAVLLEQLVERGVEKLVVASSMSVYGEGLYRASDGRIVPAMERTQDQLRAGDWEVRSAEGETLEPLPTAETKPPNLNSVYALSKYDQEQMCLIMGRAYGIQTLALRFWNAYGPYQALSNPYTGVIANFAARLMNGNPPLINEDGLQQRDFVSVYDVARACRLAMESNADQQIFNIASGQAMTVLELAGHVARAIGRKHIEPEVTGRYRAGDIRHCFADISRARRILGYEPVVPLQAGLSDLALWLSGQKASDHVLQSRAELAQRGLMV